jgi:hypothetical protein
MARRAGRGSGGTVKPPSPLVALALMSLVGVGYLAALGCLWRVVVWAWASP